MADLIVPRDMPPLDEVKRSVEGYPDLDAGAIHAMAAFMQTARVVETALEKNLMTYGLSLGRHVALYVSSRAGPEGISPAAIADQLGVTRATVTGLLDALEKDGLVVRKPHKEDGRKLIVFLTAKGKAKIEKVWPLHYGKITEALSVLDDREKTTLVRLLRKVREHADVLASPAPPSAVRRGRREA